MGSTQLVSKITIQVGGGGVVVIEHVSTTAAAGLTCLPIRWGHPTQPITIGITVRRHRVAVIDAVVLAASSGGSGGPAMAAVLVAVHFPLQRLGPLFMLRQQLRGAPVGGRNVVGEAGARRWRRFRHGWHQLMLGFVADIGRVGSCRAGYVDIDAAGASGADLYLGGPANAAASPAEQTEHQSDQGDQHEGDDTDHDANDRPVLDNWRSSISLRLSRPCVICRSIWQPDADGVGQPATVTGRVNGLDGQVEKAAGVGVEAEVVAGQ